MMVIASYNALVNITLINLIIPAIYVQLTANNVTKTKIIVQLAIINNSYIILHVFKHVHLNIIIWILFKINVKNALIFACIVIMELIVQFVKINIINLYKKK